MKTFIIAAIRCSPILTAAIASLLCTRPAQAFTVTMQQVGSNVVANGSGAINLTGLTFSISGTTTTGTMVPNLGLMGIGGNVAFPVIDQYFGAFGPASFGSSGTILNSATHSGDAVGVFSLTNNIDVPTGYVSNTPLSSSMTFSNANFASLGVTPGTYSWTWGSGLPNQNFTLVIATPSTVPDGGLTVSLLGCALLGLLHLRRNWVTTDAERSN